MHLSHIAIKLDEWYRFGPRERLHRTVDAAGRDAVKQGTGEPGFADVPNVSLTFTLPL